MKTVQLDTPASSVPFWAVMDRRARNVANKTLYTQKQITRAIRLLDALPSLYKGTFYDEPSYGTTGITVKVGKPCQVRNNKELKAYEAMLEAEGITKKETEQGILYRIKK